MKHAIMLDTPEQAQRFNRRMLNACVRAFAQAEPIRPGQLHVTIIGAGATGTELAAELHRTVRGVVAFGLDKIDPDNDIRISLVEAADRVLPALPDHIADATREIVEKLGVDIRTNSRVTEVTADGVKLGDGNFIPSELVVWAAGVKGPSVLGKFNGFEISRSNQLVIKPTLQTTRDDNIFAIGDCSYLVPEGQTRPIPPRAQAAHQQASHLVAQLRRRIHGEALRHYLYRDFGTLVSLGKSATVGSLMGLFRVEPVRRGPDAPHVPLAAQDARARTARTRQGRPRYLCRDANTAFGAPDQAALRVPDAIFDGAASWAVNRRSRFPSLGGRHYAAWLT